LQNAITFRLLVHLKNDMYVKNEKDFISYLQ